MIADYIRHLSELASADASSVGAKAATLGDLMLAGFRVPVGFCIPASGYRHFVACAGLDRQLAEIFAQADFTNPAHCEGADAEIRRLFLAARLPYDLRRALEHAYLALSHRAGEDEAPVAVRPSPLGADVHSLPPGYHEGLLNVIGVESLGGALKQCWASLHSSQALQRRAALQGYPEGDPFRVARGAAREMPHESAALPVIVQLLVGAAASGAMFTADPQSGDPLRIVIAACFGLGEGVDGGALAADRFVVDAATMAVVERDVADKALMVGRADEGTHGGAPGQGTIVVAVPQARRQAASLSDEQILALARVGMQVDQHFDMRCEIGWALSDGEVFVLGAKPIVRLPAFFPAELPDDRRRTFVLSLSRPDPVPPLSEDLWRLIVRRFNRGASRGRMLGCGFGRWRLALVNGYQYGHRELRDPWRPRSAPGAGLRFLLQAPLANWLHRRWRGTALPRAERARRRLQELAPKASAQEAGGVVLDLVASLDELLGYGYILGPLAREVSQPAPRLLRRLGRGAPDDLLAAADGMPTARAMALWGLIRQAREHWPTEQAFAADLPAEVARNLERDAQGRDFLDQVRRFAAEHALLDPLALADLDDGPAWLQDVGSLLMAMRQHILGPRADPEQALRQRAAAHEQAAQAARARLSATGLSRLWRWRRSLFDYVLRTARALQPLADDCREDAPMRAAAALREGLRLLADAMVRDGFLESPEEMAFLSLADIAAAAQGSLRGPAFRSAVEARRRRLRRLACLQPPACIAPVAEVRQQPAPASPVAEGSRLAGAPCSPGKATGPARFVDSPGDLAHFHRGDVLVCERASTVHTILFSMAAAFVQEEDALASHCALLAREYGVPAVAGVPGLARRVRDGQVVTVDGTSGTISLEPEARS